MDDAHFLAKLRFDKKYVVDHESGCWLWEKCLDKFGYGKFSFRSTNVVASRFSFELHHGPIAHGFCVCHRCDTPRCVNPNHLFLGTHRDNAIDRDKKGRGRWSSAKSTPVGVVELSSGRYQAYFSVNGKKITAGVHGTVDEALHARTSALLLHNQATSGCEAG